VPIDLLDPNPNQPRQAMGDLSELIASVSEKGIIEPLIVRQLGGRFQIIAGERRYHASVQAGLREVPVVIRDADDVEVMELALVENLQRKDLTAFEESEALQQLCEHCQYTHEDLAQKLGKSRTSITESLSLVAMPEEVRRLCRLADITAKSTLLQIVRQGDPKRMIALVERVAAGGGTRQVVRAETAKATAGRPEAVRVRVPGADQGLQPEVAFLQVQGRPQRGHRGARGHPQGTEVQARLGPAGLCGESVRRMSAGRHRALITRRAAGGASFSEPTGMPATGDMPYVCAGSSAR
jgi:ParB family chromosome partitioning protein